MRGEDLRQDALFSYLSPEARVPQDHPLRPIHQLVDRILAELSPAFARLYARTGGPSVRPSSYCAPCSCRCSTPSAASGCWSSSWTTTSCSGGSWG